MLCLYHTRYKNSGDAHTLYTCSYDLIKNLKHRIDKWLTGIKKVMFLYGDGHFELPFLSNSPEVIITTLKSMPLAKHNIGEKVITTNNIFTKATITYRELADGLWVIVSEMEFKKDICIKPVYDDGPCNYYYLSHFAYTNLYQSILPNQAPAQTKGWVLYKPGTPINLYFKKGDNGVFINFAFDKTWFERNIPLMNIADESINALQTVIGADAPYFGHTIQAAETAAAKVLKLIKQEGKMQFNTLVLKMNCLDAINQFFSNSAAPKKNDATPITAADRRLAGKAEKMLTLSLTSEFPGIEAIALLLHTSPTKLKTSFKAVNQTSLYKYYSEMQMEQALVLLNAETTSVKALAHVFGYDSPSKFSAAFYKHHKFHPSKINQ